MERMLAGDQMLKIAGRRNAECPNLIQHSPIRSILNEKSMGMLCGETIAYSQLRALKESDRIRSICKAGKQSRTVPVLTPYISQANVPLAHLPARAAGSRVICSRSSDGKIQ